MIRLIKKKNLLLLFIVVGLGSGFWCSSTSGQVFTFQQGVSEYTGCQDKTITAPGWVNPSNTRLRVKAEYPSGDEKYNTLIRFDDIESTLSGLSVQEASITLTFQDENIEWSPATLDIYPCLRHWDDPSWDEAVPSQVSWTTPGAQGVGTDRGELQTSFYMGDRHFPDLQYTDNYSFEINLPVSLVQGWIDFPSDNHGLIFTMNPAAATDVTFSSSEDETIFFRPQLKVVVPEPTTFSLLILGGMVSRRRKRNPQS